MGEHKYGSLEDRKQKMGQARLIIKTVGKAIVQLEAEIPADVGIRDGVTDLVAMTVTLRGAAMTIEREREAIIEMAITEGEGEGVY